LIMASDPNIQPQSELETVALDHDTFGRLVLIDVEGRRHVGVDPVRAFPLSDPQHSISIVNSEGVEVLWIEDLTTLAPRTRKILLDELSRREFMPIIERILSVSSTNDPSRWQVRTDRGETTFLLKSDDDVRRIGTHGAMLIDAAGARYLAPDTRKLDAASRRVLERYL
jgi:hypothetical protein